MSAMLDALVARVVQIGSLREDVAFHFRSSERMMAVVGVSRIRNFHNFR